MRRLLAITLLVMLCVPQLAKAEAPLDEAQIERLLNVVPMMTFTGAPDSSGGWDAVTNLLNETPKAHRKHFNMEALQKLHRGLFIEGKLSGKPETHQFGGYFKKQGKGYMFMQEDEPGISHIAINEIVPQRDGTFVVDYTHYTTDPSDDAYYGDSYWGNARARLALDPDAPFGAKVRAMRITREWHGDFFPASASSDAGDNPESAVDDDESTGWSFDPEQTPDAELVIRFDPDTQVRGLIVAMGDGSSPPDQQASQRVGKLRATLSDGSVREVDSMDMSGGPNSWNEIVLVFRRIQTGGEIRLCFPETGSGANRVYVSEVRAF